MTVDGAWEGDPEGKPCEMGGGELADYSRADGQEQGVRYMRRAQKRTTVIGAAHGIAVRGMVGEALSAVNIGEAIHAGIDALMRNVFVVFDNCPSQWGEPGIKKVFQRRRDAVRWMNEQKGKDPCGRQYWEVQRWRVTR